MFNYIQSFKTEGGNRDAVATRHEVFLRRFLFTANDLVPKDSRRTYNQDERIITWRMSNGKCAVCSSTIQFEEMHADHRTPHAAGGTTTISNAQCLCRTCNLKKGG